MHLLGIFAGWLVAGLAGRIVLSVITQGVVVAGTLFWGGEMAEWATGKMVDFIRHTDFWEQLGKAFGAFGGLPEAVLQLWGCFGARDVFVAFVAGQISAIGVALICRKLL